MQRERAARREAGLIVGRQLLRCDGFRNLAAILRSFPNFRQKLRDLGGIKDMVNAMKANSRDEELQMRGCLDLKDLAGDQETRVEIRESDGIQPLLMAIGNFGGSGLYLSRHVHPRWR